jgi:hypothetical protein
MPSKPINIDCELLAKIEAQYPEGSWSSKIERLLQECNKSYKIEKPIVTNVTHTCKFDISLIKDAIDQAIHEATQR